MKLFLVIIFNLFFAVFCLAQDSEKNKKIIILDYELKEINGETVRVDRNGMVITCLLPSQFDIQIAAPNEIVKGEILTVISVRDAQFPNVKAKYKWTISDGKIKGGHKNSAILIETKKVKSNKIIATLDVEIEYPDKQTEKLKLITETQLLSRNL